VRELHVVAVSEDGRHVLLAGRRGATKGGFRLALDERLAAAVRGDLPRPGGDQAPASELTPKQIQARLRAGESAESIAQAAGVPVGRVERFSGPVQGEMARVIDAVRESYLVRGRRGRSVVPLGEAVDAALAHAGAQVPETIDWSTHREEDGCWVVTVAWFARKRTRTASWRYDPLAKQVHATDPASAALGHLGAEGLAGPRPHVAVAAPARPAPAKKAPAKQAPAKKAPAKRAPAKKAPAKPARAGKAAAKQPPVTRAATRRPPARKAPTTPAGNRSSAEKAAAPKRAPGTKAAAAKAPARKAAPAPVRRTTPGKRALRVVPDPAPARTTSAAERDGVKTRASVPAWADVLLGTTPGGER
jgi:hypothetical protein